MSEPIQPDRFNPIAVIDALLDGDITPADHAALDRWIAADREHAAMFVARTRLHRNLHMAIRQQTESPTAVTSPTHRTITPYTHRDAWRSRRPLAIAAGLILAAGVAIYIFAVANRQPSRVHQPNTTLPIATLVDASNTVFVNDNIANLGSENWPGGYTIDSGFAKFLLSNRVTVTLVGKTSLTMSDAMHAALTRGSASFHVPPDAHGFAVQLSNNTRIVDLGTAFRVDVDDARHFNIHVTEGHIRIDLTAPGGSQRSVTLFAGDLARITNDVTRGPVLTFGSANDLHLIGPGADVANATTQDTPHGDRLNVDRRQTLLPAGTYHLSDWVVDIADHTQGGPTGTITPMLVTGKPGAYTTLWVGDAFKPSDNGVQSVIASGTFTLTQPTPVYAGFFTAHGACAIIAYAKKGSTDHDISFTGPRAAGQTVDGFNILGLDRTYVFGVTVISEPTSTDHRPAPAAGSAHDATSQTGVTP